MKNLSPKTKLNLLTAAHAALGIPAQSEFWTDVTKYLDKVKPGQSVLIEPRKTRTV